MTGRAVTFAAVMARADEFDLKAPHASPKDLRSRAWAALQYRSGYEACVDAAAWCVLSAQRTDQAQEVDVTSGDAT